MTSAGVFSIPREGGWFDCHYHDFDEYWLVFGGCARIVTEGMEYLVRRGDIVCTRAGDEHDVLEVYEGFEAFWFEGPCPPGGRTGHLHRLAEHAAGHPVPARPLSAGGPLEEG